MRVALLERGWRGIFGVLLRVRECDGVLDARWKSRVGVRQPSRCLWCSYLGRCARKGWTADLHILCFDEDDLGGKSVCDINEDKRD